VFGAAKHGYFETSPNQDAIAFRVADDVQAKRIYDKIASIPGLRPHQFILPNYPSYDDMYEEPQGLWGFGTWVNGGHWSTCEARMILGYYRLGQFDDARRSLRQWLTFAERFRLDNPLVKFGSEVYQPNQPINLTYDAFGPPAAFVRGLFEYLYRADGLTLVPHVPPGITRLEQRFPVRFGTKRVYLATVGTGPITGVTVNGTPWKSFDRASIVLPCDQIPNLAAIEVEFGNTAPRGFQVPATDHTPQPIPAHLEDWLREKANETAQPAPASMATARPLRHTAERLPRFHQLLVENGLGESYEAAHARLVIDSLASAHQRAILLGEGKLKRLADPVSQAAADQMYLDTARKLSDGLIQLISAHKTTTDPRMTRVAQLWNQTAIGHR
jgi:hypothetical protein